MKKEFFTRYVIEDGKLTQIKISRKEALKEIDKLLKRDKEFLEIMAKM